MSLILNVGSGQRPFPAPWINIDSQARWNPDLVCDASKLPYEDGSCSMIVYHQVLEHATCGGGGLLEEVHRLLEPGGTLFVFVPNMRALAQRWLAGMLDDETYLINVYGAYMGHEDDRHKFGFTPATLQKLLRSKFSEVRTFDWRPIEGMNAARDWWVLAMEAIK